MPDKLTIVNGAPVFTEPSSQAEAATYIEMSPRGADNITRPTSDEDENPYDECTRPADASDEDENPYDDCSECTPP